MALRKKVIIASITIVVLFAAGGLYYLFSTFGKYTDDTSTIDQNTSDAKISPETTRISQQAQDAYVKGSFSGAVKQYDNALKNTSLTTEDRGDLLKGKATLYFNDNKLEDALAIAKEADNTAPTRFTAALIGDIYRDLGDKTNAVSYYNRAIERITMDGYGDLPFNDKDYYETRIKIANGS